MIVSIPTTCVVSDTSIVFTSVESVLPYSISAVSSEEDRRFIGSIIRKTASSTSTVKMTAMGGILNDLPVFAGFDAFLGESVTLFEGLPVSCFDSGTESSGRSTVFPSVAHFSQT